MTGWLDAQDDPALLDAEVLMTSCFGERALAATMLAMLAEQLAALEKAWPGAGDAVRRDLAHRLKGSAQTLGARPLAEAAALAEADPAAAGPLLLEAAARLARALQRSPGLVSAHKRR